MDLSKHTPNKSKNKYISLLLSILPIAGFVMLGLGYSLAYYLQHESLSGHMAGWKIIARATLVVGGVMLTAQILFCVFGQGKYRVNAIASLLATTLSIIVCVFFMDYVFPARNTIPERSTSITQYSKTQVNLQTRLRYRSMQINTSFRGVELKWSTNSLGWPDVERSYTGTSRRFVFIGDSFLADRSSRNVARLVEDRFSSAGEPIEIINLSQSNTDPEDYRYRLQELAADYGPELIVLFLYAGNDFSSNYKFTPYRHEHFSVSRDALHFIRLNMDIPDALEDKLEQMHANGVRFADQDEFLKMFEGSALSEMDNDFIYQVVYAFSSWNASRFPLRDLAPSTLTRLTQVWSQWLSDPGEQSGWRAYQSEYIRIFRRPLSERLELIAELAARMNKSSDVEHFRSSLAQLPRAFIDELVAEPDMTYFLWPALNYYVLHKPVRPIFGRGLLNQAAAEYLKLIDNMQQTSTDIGARLMVVLIPEASQVDNDFYSFWKPLFNFRSYKFGEHQISRMVSNQLRSSEEAIIVLADYSDRFQESYWHFDGHWNEQGNAAAADIIYTELQKIITH